MAPSACGATCDTLTAAQARAYAARVEALGFGTVWVPETVGRDPFTLLGLLAAETGRMALGTSIASIWARDAQTTRMAAHTIDEATGGRFVLGLGVSHPHLAERLRGHVYERPLAHMREYLAAYERAVYKGPAASDGADPPILLAALRDHMVALAATETDGAFPYLVTPERVAWIRQHLDAAAEAAAGAAGAPRARPLLAVTMPVVTESRAGDGAGRRPRVPGPVSAASGLPGLVGPPGVRGRRSREAGQRPARRRDGRLGRHAGHLAPLARPPGRRARTTLRSSRCRPTAPPKTWPPWRPLPRRGLTA